jgi:hypothetical protein
LRRAPLAVSNLHAPSCAARCGGGGAIGFLGGELNKWRERERE